MLLSMRQELKVAKASKALGNPKDDGPGFAFGVSVIKHVSHNAAPGGDETEGSCGRNAEMMHGLRTEEFTN